MSRRSDELATDEEGPLDLRDLAAPDPPPGPVAAFSAVAHDLGLRPRTALVAIVVAVGAALGAWWWWHDPPPSAAEASLPVAGVATVPSAVTTVPAGEVVAHAAGQVVRPGVYTLAAGARIADLIEAAGGPQPDADLDRVNLAAPLGDGAQVRVPAIGEASASPPVGGDGVAEGATVLIDLNTADAAALEALPGVGPATSAAIVAHRAETGPFTAVADLLEVRGIGEAKLAAIEELVTV